MGAPGAVVAVSDDGRQLSLGGMVLVANHGDIDIYVRGNSTIIPTLRLQRADLGEIVAFLLAAQEAEH